MKINRVNLGELVKQKVNEQGLSNAQFAKSLGIARQNIVNTVFLKQSLDTDLLIRICEVLQCNFFDYFYDKEESNKTDYTKEIKAILTIEMGHEKQDKTFHFSFGNNEVKIQDK